MSRSERWNTRNEIKRRFHETTDKANGAGPVVYVENGRKYSDDSEAHIGVVGRTGKGKSQCCSLPFMREILQKGESLIMLDPKGEGYKMNACYIPDDYQVFCVDFRNPRKSPTKWNPLSTPFRLFRSKDPDDNDIASSMLSELWNGVYPYDGHSDKFWTDSSVNYAKGLTYGLFETAAKEQINLDSVAVMMEQSEIRYAAGTLLKAFYETLPLDSLAKRNLATYVTAPNETRASIHSVAASGLEVFSRSKGLMEMLSEDTLNIMDIDVNRPFILTIITPDETDVYDALSGLLISQFSQHLIRVAQEKGGKLPIRVNIILEELGSVGKSIPTLPNLMVASRSRNMRLKTLDFESMVKAIKKKQMESAISNTSMERRSNEMPMGFPFLGEERSETSPNLDSLMSRIDAKIAELEAEEEAERKKKNKKHKHHVFITAINGDRAKLAHIISATTGESVAAATKKLNELPIDLSFATKDEAIKFARNITNAGGVATIKTS